MPSKIRTTVVLTKKARAIKARYANALGVKGILSVGLELFEDLSDTDKIHRVAGAIEADEIVAAAEADTVKQKQKRGRRQPKVG